jgi:hypothetical protein
MPARMRAASPRIRHPDSFRAAGERHHLKRFSSPQSRPRNEALGEDKRLADWPASRLDIPHRDDPSLNPTSAPAKAGAPTAVRRCSVQPLIAPALADIARRRAGSREGAKVRRCTAWGGVVLSSQSLDGKGRYRGGRNTFAPSRLRANIPRRYASRVSRIPIRPIPHPPRRHHAGRAVAARPAGPARGRGPA